MNQYNSENIVVSVNDVTVRFNMASERIDNLKEYFVKIVKRELMFKEFLALKNISFEVNKGEAQNNRNERFRKIYVAEGNMRNLKTI